MNVPVAMPRSLGTGDLALPSLDGKTFIWRALHIFPPIFPCSPLVILNWCRTNGRATTSPTWNPGLPAALLSCTEVA